MKNSNTISITIKQSTGNLWYKNLIGQTLNATKYDDDFLVDVEDNNIYMDYIPVRGFMSGIVEAKDCIVNSNI